MVMQLLFNSAGATGPSKSDGLDADQVHIFALNTRINSVICQTRSIIFAVLGYDTDFIYVAPLCIQLYNAL